MQRKITIAADASRLAEVRRVLRDFCREHGLSQLATLRFVLAVDELSANVIEHSELNGSSSIEITVGLENGAATAEIVDCGKAFDPREAHSPPRGIAGLAKRGFGLPLVRLIARSMDYKRTSDGRNIVRLAMPIACVRSGRDRAGATRYAP